jgi:hypothetical protein
MIDIAVVAAPLLLVVMVLALVGTTHAQTFYVRGWMTLLPTCVEAHCYPILY